MDLQVLNTLLTKNFQAIFKNISQKLLYTLPTILPGHLKPTSPENFPFQTFTINKLMHSVQKMVSKASVNALKASLSFKTGSILNIC